MKIAVKRDILDHMDPQFSKLNRIEDKYVVNRDEAAAIQREVEKHLKPYFVEPGVKFEFIKSTYLDSDKLTFYRNHLDEKYPRIKMRIRQYAPNGTWNPDDVFLEIKEKGDDGETTKTRIQLDPVNLANVQAGRKIQVNDDMKELNSNQSSQQFHAFVRRANDYISRFRLKPVVSVMYKRIAYQDKDVRVTIDYNIIYKTENTLNLMKVFSIINSIDWSAAKKYGKKYDTQKNAVVEVKYATKDQEKGAPEWVQEMLKDQKMDETRFSKYVWALYQLLMKVLG